MYVAVKGGERAIDSAHRQLAEQRRGDPAVPELSVAQIREQLRLAVDRVMTEGALYDADLAALAIKQARGDLMEAIFLIRAYRTTLPRFAASEPVDTARMVLRRRISATFKDLPGGQILGPTFDYTHRLLDFALLAEENGGDAAVLYRQRSRETSATPSANEEPVPRVADLLGSEGLIQPDRGDQEAPVGDLTRDPLAIPACRDVRLQALARGDEGFLLALGYSSQRGFGHTHPFAGEIRIGEATVELVPEDLGFVVEIGEITLTECDMINQFTGSDRQPAQFTRGYGLAFGEAERKAMAMALVDRALRCDELGEPATAPAQDQEFVLCHSDNVEASGFVQHLKLPHYVDFQAELELIRKLREDRRQAVDESEELDA